MQKGKKFVTFALISTYGTTMVLHKEGVYRDGTIDEKVTVISPVVHTYIHSTYQAKMEVEMGSVHFFLLLKLETP